MDTETIIYIVLGLIGVGYTTYRWLKMKSSKPDEVVNHFISIDVNAYTDEKTDKSFFSHINKYFTTIAGKVYFMDKNIERVTITVGEKGYSGKYSRSKLETDMIYVTKSSGLPHTNKTKALWLEYDEGTSDLKWRGDDESDLSQRLNSDLKLSAQLIHSGLAKHPIKLEYDEFKTARITTDYLLPTREQFETLDRIAGHIKAVW